MAESAQHPGASCFVKIQACPELTFFNFSRTYGSAIRSALGQSLLMEVTRAAEPLTSLGPIALPSPQQVESELAWRDVVEAGALPSHRDIAS